ncbi:MAG: manganese efflux pump MntP [Vulcanimicrobiaceae bacterium]
MITFAAAIKIVVIALSLALDVFAVSIGVGVRGVPRKEKIRIGIAFATAEIVMNLAGVGLGLAVGKLLGEVAGYIGFVALLCLGCFMMYESRREESHPLDMSRGWGLFIASLSISLDSLGIGFSILYINVPLVESLAVIGTVSIAATATGISVGRRLGEHIGEHAEFLGGVLLALTGAGFILLKALHIG